MAPETQPAFADLVTRSGHTPGGEIGQGRDVPQVGAPHVPHWVQAGRPQAVLWARPRGASVAGAVVVLEALVLFALQSRGVCRVSMGPTGCSEGRVPLRVPGPSKCLLTQVLP